MKRALAVGWALAPTAALGVVLWVLHHQPPRPKPVVIIRLAG